MDIEVANLYGRAVPLTDREAEMPGEQIPRPQITEGTPGLPERPLSDSEATESRTAALGPCEWPDCIEDGVVGVGLPPKNYCLRHLDGAFEPIGRIARRMSKILEGNQ